jgi:hypothetical protein
MSVIAGRSCIVNGLDPGPSFNLSDASHGLQGGFSNYVGTEGWGLQAGAANFVGRGHVDDGYSGLQVAGFSNSGSADGIQLAGYFNGALKRSRDIPWIHGDIRGLQIAGVANIAKSVAGVQVAAGNASFEGFSGLQVGGINFAGGANRSRPVQDTAWIPGDDVTGPVWGLQIAGAANLAFADHVAGVQVAALFNVSGDSFSGLQVGGVNVVESRTDIEADARGMCSGVQVGVINMVGGGSVVQFGLWNSNPDGFLPYFPILNFSF